MAGEGASAVGGLLGSGGITGSLEDIFGTSKEVTGTGTATESGKTTEYLELDEEAITKILEDLLGSAQGLASIFSGEQATGLYSSSAAAAEAGDFAAQVVGELAKITGKKVSTTDKTTTSTQKQKEESGGLLDQAGGLLGGLTSGFTGGLF